VALIAATDVDDTNSIREMRPCVAARWCARFYEIVRERFEREPDQDAWMGFTEIDPALVTGWRKVFVEKTLGIFAGRAALRQRVDGGAKLLHVRRLGDGLASEERRVGVRRQRSA
jgi:hypothetical protein